MLTKPCFKRHIHATRLDLPSISDPEHSICLHYGRELGIILEDMDETQMRLLSLLNGQHTFDEIVARLQQTDPTITAQDVSDALEQLTQQGMLEDAAVEPPADFSTEYLKRYESQFRFLSVLDPTGTQKYALQAKLKNAHVTVIGLGGLGSLMLQDLAAIGVGSLRGVDFDLVELSNLNRQVLYDMDDIGTPKTQAAAQHIARLNPEVRFEPIQRQITGPQDIIEVIEGTDLFACCADVPRTIGRWMNEASLATGIPFIRGGYHGAVAEVGPLVIPSQTQCLHCILGGDRAPVELAELAWIEEDFWLRHPNIHFLTVLAANLLCSDIFKYLTGTGQPATYNTLYALNIEQFTLTPVNTTRLAECDVCGWGKAALEPSTSGQH